VLGARHLARPDWPPGSVIYTGHDDDPEWFAVLVVEEV
jgi:hypothetical protein